MDAFGNLKAGHGLVNLVTQRYFHGDDDLHQTASDDD